MKEEDRIEKRVSYKEAKRAVKKEVTKAKNRGYENLYRKLDTKGGGSRFLNWQGLGPGSSKT